jgi:O-antigen/teichoic acid export membrane protein
MHPALRDLGVVGASGFVTAVAGMLVISVVGKAFGAALLGEYLLIRRMASWLQAGVQLPSGVALPRYVSASLDDSNSPKLSYFVSALLAACAIGLLTCCVLLVWRHRIGQLFFGSSTLEHLLLPLGILLMGFAVHGAVYGYLQGMLQMGRASALQICNIAVFPLGVAILLRSYRSVALLVIASSILMIVCACGFAVPFLRQGNFLISLEELKRHGYELVSYGYSRVAHDFGLQGLLSLPAVIAAHYFPMSSVGYLLLAGTFLTMVATGTLPLAIILLSRVSRSIAQTGTDQLKKRVSYFVSALIELSVFICLQMILFADVFVRFWVGPTFLEGIRVIQIVILSVPFYFIHAGLRGVIDAASLKAYNAWNVCIAGVSFVACVILVLIFMPHAQLLDGLAAAGVMGMFVLACCSTRTVMKLFEINLDWPRLTPGICVGLLFGALSFWLHDLRRYQPGLIALVAYQVALTATYLLVLGLINPPWVRFFRSNMLTYSSQPKEKSAISA